MNWNIGDRIRARLEADVAPCTFDAILSRLIRFLTGALIIVLCLWMGVGTIKMVLALDEILDQAWTVVIEHVIINSLIMLALLEVIRTLQVYLQHGYVRVVFIIDTALVVLIGELMGLWFREYSPEKVWLGISVIALLTVLRILISRFSPDPEDKVCATHPMWHAAHQPDPSNNPGDKS